MKQLASLIWFFLCIPSIAEASANRLVAQSLAATGLGGACIAQLTGPDSAYWNPANLNDLEDRQSFEMALHATHIPSQHYQDSRIPFYNGDSESLTSYRPTLFYNSAAINAFRFGFSLTTPFGLSKEWDEPFPATFARKYSLQTFDLNPAVAYGLTDQFNIAVGLRGVYAKAEVENSGMLAGETFSRDLEGDGFALGYNLAASYTPAKGLRLGLTYRSKVDLDLEGDALLATSTGLPGTRLYNGTGSVEYPLPAVLAAAVSYSFSSVTLELAWDRTYWSIYESLDFQYSSPLGNPYLLMFDTPIAKNWQDTDAFHLGLSWQAREDLLLMAGITIDESPVPDATLNFEMPDSDLTNYSCGLRYGVTPSTRIGVAYLYTDKDDRTVTNDLLSGTFSNSRAHTLTIGLQHLF